MKLISLICLILCINVANATIYKMESCDVFQLDGGFAYAQCWNVDWWTNKTERVSWLHAKYDISPFSPTRTWTNESNTVVGMSSKNSFVLVVNPKNATSELIHATLLRVLDSEPPSYAEGEGEEEVYTEEIPEHQKELEATFRILYQKMYDYMFSHVKNHKPINDFADDLTNDLDEEIRSTLKSAFEYFTADDFIPTLPFLCEENGRRDIPVILSWREDLSAVAEPGNCRIDKISATSQYVMAGEEIWKWVSALMENYPS